MAIQTSYNVMETRKRKRSNKIGSEKLIRSNPRLNLPAPHKKFKQYFAIKQKSDLSYEINRPIFLEYCEEIVQRGGIGTLQKLLRDAIKHDYKNYSDITVISDDSDGSKVSRISVVQQGEAAHQKQILLQLKRDGQNRVETRQQKQPTISLTTLTDRGTYDGNNPQSGDLSKNKLDDTNPDSDKNDGNGDDVVGSNVHEKTQSQIGKSVRFADELISKPEETKGTNITSIKSIPSINQIKSRIHEYILKSGKKILLYNDLSEKDISIVVELYSSSYDTLRKYYKDFIKHSMGNDLKLHVDIYIDLYNFYLIQYVLREKRKDVEGCIVDNYRLKSDYIKGYKKDYPVINSASSGAFSMIQSFFIVPLVIPEFRDVFHFFDGPFSLGILKREQEVFNNSPYVSKILCDILPSVQYDELMNTVLENGREVYGRLIDYFTKGDN